MRTPEEHLAAVTRAVPRPRTVTVALADAAGRTLAEDIRAAHPSPRFDNSQMDGYALSAAHLAAAPATFPVGPTLPAGTDPATLYPEGVGGAVVPIMTGAKTPEGTTAIVPVEDCCPAEFPAEGDTVEVPATGEGRFIRRAGSDIAVGQMLFEAGTRLNAVAVGVLAGQDVAHVPVLERARVLICTGGAEIGAAGPAAVPDANAPMLRVLCGNAGVEVAGHLRTDDDPVRLRADLAAALAAHSPTAVITSGGISHGKFEVIRQLLGDDGWFGHVAQQPGGPQGLASFHGVPVICLPGNPVSTLVSFRLFVAPVLGHVPEPVTARLHEEVTGLPDKEQFRRGRIHLTPDGTAVAHPVGGAGSHLLAQSFPANCLIRIPAGQRLAADDPVTVYPL